MITFDKISKILKQKSPFVFVDRVLEIEDGKSIVAIKNITASEMFAALHFPTTSIYPGILVIEAVAQTASVLCSYSEGMIDKDEDLFLALGGISRFSFINPARPGDTMKICVEIIKAVGSMVIVEALVTIEDKTIAKGQLSFGVGKNE